ncbi:MAG: hypothetical protein IT379_38190 [Deltaproteobacteria bacterium]|nr:hypothetical protein [Deltaproteobacteria bacterium]
MNRPLGDMCSIGYHRPTNRWYFHYENEGFRTTAFTTDRQTDGYCAGTSSTSAP